MKQGADRRENAVLTEYEHYSNISPWVELKGGKLREVRLARLKAMREPSTWRA